MGGLAGATVVAGQIARVAAGVDDVGVVGPHGDVPTFAAADLLVVHARDRREARAAGHADGGVVLLRAVDAVWHLIVSDDVVELRGRLIVQRRPRLGAVEGDRCAAVVALDDAATVLRVKPHVVVVAVGHGHLGKRLAAVDRPPQTRVQHPDGVGILWVGVDVQIVPGPAARLALLAQLLPRLAAVVRAEDGAILGVDDGPHTVRARRRDHHADLAEGALGQPLVARDVRPGVAAVGRLPEAGALAAADELMGLAHGFPEGGVGDARVVGIHREIAGARGRAAEEHALPRLAAIARAVDAAGLVGAVGVAKRGNIYHIRILWVGAYLGDIARVLQAEMRPGLAGVGGFVDAVTMRDIATNRGLSHAGVDHIGVRGRDGQRADRGALEEAVRDVLPVDAAVGRLPDATPGGAEVEHLPVVWVAGHRHHASAAVRPREPPLKRVQIGGRLGLALHVFGAGQARRALIRGLVRLCVFHCTPSSVVGGGTDAAISG